ncbi:MAG: hypothetical protein B7Z55_08245 [Planctomycetales bacterium 12-60-4]|nr:MAG: hypothetical protein B7Z55_08245 [Planctomycetales bacterium 12-60-4]
MATHFYLDAPHTSTDLLTPILASHRQWWSRGVEALLDAQGAIVLRGTVTSYHHKQLAQEAFRSIGASPRIHNELRVLRVSNV